MSPSETIAGRGRYRPKVDRIAHYPLTHEGYKFWRLDLCCARPRMRGDILFQEPSWLARWVPAPAGTTVAQGRDAHERCFISAGLDIAADLPLGAPRVAEPVRHRARGDRGGRRLVGR